MSRVDDLLAETKALLGDFKNFKKPEKEFYNSDESPLAFRQNDIRYPRVTKIYSVLIPEDFKWRQYSLDIYEGDDWNELAEPLIVTGEDNYYTIVRHGHERSLTCFGPSLCHVHGYKPKGNESPVFLKAFKAKWGD